MGKKNKDNDIKIKVVTSDTVNTKDNAAATYTQTWTNTAVQDGKTTKDANQAAKQATRQYLRSEGVGKNKSKKIAKELNQTRTATVSQVNSADYGTGIRADASVGNASAYTAVYKGGISTDTRYFKGTAVESGWNFGNGAVLGYRTTINGTVATRETTYDPWNVYQYKNMTSIYNQDLSSGRGFTFSQKGSYNYSNIAAENQFYSKSAKTIENYGSKNVNYQISGKVGKGGLLKNIRSNTGDKLEAADEKVAELLSVSFGGQLFAQNFAITDKGVKTTHNFATPKQEKNSTKSTSTKPKSTKTGVTSPKTENKGTTPSGTGTKSGDVLKKTADKRGIKARKGIVDGLKQEESGEIMQHYKEERNGREYDITVYKDGRVVEKFNKNGSKGRKYEVIKTIYPDGKIDKDSKLLEGPDTNPEKNLVGVGNRGKTETVQRSDGTYRVSYDSNGEIASEKKISERETEVSTGKTKTDGDKNSNKVKVLTDEDGSQEIIEKREDGSKIITETNREGVIIKQTIKDKNGKIIKTTNYGPTSGSSSSSGASSSTKAPQPGGSNNHQTPEEDISKIVVSKETRPVTGKNGKTYGVTTTTYLDGHTEKEIFETGG